MDAACSELLTRDARAGVPTLGWTVGLEGGVGCNPQVTFDGKGRNLGPCVFEFDSPLPEDHRAHILSPPLQTRRRLRLDLRQQCLPRVEAG
jgi:hypothetical protein